MLEKKIQNRKIEYAEIPGHINHYRIYIPDVKNIPLGYAIVSSEDGEAILWHIFIHPQYRRQKLAAHLIKALQACYSSIITGWESRPGKKLCLSCGFKFDDKKQFLVWERTNVQNQTRGLNEVDNPPNSSGNASGL